MNFIVGSGTTYNRKNPSFNVIYLDPETMLPVDYESHSFDLERANAKDEAVWSKQYDVKEYYNMSDLSPQSYWEHSRQIFYNEEAAIKYRNNRWLNGPGAGDLTAGCDYACRMIFYCETMAGDYDEWQFCRENDIVEFFNGESLLTIEQAIDHTWYYPKME